jgi:hypothetical protein
LEHVAPYSLGTALLALGGVICLILIIALTWLAVKAIPRPDTANPVPPQPSVLGPVERRQDHQTPEKPAQEKPAQGVPVAKAAIVEPGERWDDVHNTGRVSDITVECAWAKSSWASVKIWGQWSTTNLMVVQLKLTNHLPTKIVEFKGWQSGGSMLEDEHGNQYHRLDLGRGFDGFGDNGWGRNPAWQSSQVRLQGCEFVMIADAFRLDPGKSYVTHLFFSKPADVSKEARLTLSANKLGGGGTIRIRVLIQQAALNCGEMNPSNPLYRAYEGDEAAADGQYLNKRVQFILRPWTVDKDERSGVYYAWSNILGDATRGRHITCYFRADQGAALSKFQRGQVLAITGVCAGKTGMVRTYYRPDDGTKGFFKSNPAIEFKDCVLVN